MPDSPVLRRLALTHFLLECQFWFPVWMLFLSTRGFDLTTMVLADGVFRFTMVALEFPAGVLSDRIGRKRSYLWVAFLAGLTYAGIVAIHGTWHLFLVWIVWGGYWALASGTTSAYCYELVAAEGKQADAVAVMGFMRAVASAAALASHLAAGFLFTLTPALPFAVSSVLALAALVLALKLPDVPGAAREEVAIAGRTGAWLAPLQAFHRRDRAFWAGIVLLALALVYFWSPRILMQPLFLELELPPPAVSTVYFFYSLAGVAAGLAANRVRGLLGTRGAVMAGVGMLWVGVLLIALVPGYPALIFFPLLSFGYFVAHTLLEVSLHHRMDNRHRASVLSAASLFGGVFIIVTRPGLGILADWQSTPFAFLVWALVGIPVVAVFGFLIRRVPSHGE